MPSPVKVLFLAMDAADKFLIQKWAADGTLPNIRSMLAEGLVGETMSLEGLYEGSTWPCFYTGVSPAHHGFHSLIQLKPGSYELFRCYPNKFIQRRAFWQYLSDAGKNVAILDIPLSGIARGLQGIQMVEWASHDGVHGFQTWPPELKSEVLRRFGRHPVKRSCDSYRRTPHNFSLFKDHLIKGVRKKAELTIHYLKKGGWDFFAQVFSESHCVGHQCWHLHDRGHPSYNPTMANQIGDPVCDVYKAIDSAIGKILAEVGKDTTIFFLASHRMSHTFGGNFLLGKILEKLGYLKICPQRVRVSQLPGQIKTSKDLLAWGWRKIPNKIRSIFEPNLLSLYDLILERTEGGDLLPLPSYIRNIDFHHSVCFPVPNGNAVSGIRINLSGREPNGIIKPGKEMHDCCTSLIRDLLNIINEKNGKALIKSIKMASVLYEGEYSDYLPDLFIEWNDETSLGSLAIGDQEGSQLRLVSEKLGVLEGKNTYCRTGDHRPEGLFMAIGPGIKAGRMSRTVSIMDFYPTFVKLFGLPMPPVDGSPIHEILEMWR